MLGEIGETKFETCGRTDEEDGIAKNAYVVDGDISRPFSSSFSQQEIECSQYCTSSNSLLRQAIIYFKSRAHSQTASQNSKMCCRKQNIQHNSPAIVDQRRPTLLRMLVDHIAEKRKAKKLEQKYSTVSSVSQTGWTERHTPDRGEPMVAMEQQESTEWVDEKQVGTLRPSMGLEPQRDEAENPPSYDELR